ncbi:MAG: AAA family ATPase [Alphaproteobacteria bacterium]|jgi:predicted ATP-dependent protease|nr:AAA family ATPase [Alphaproteobacteria bacterium]MBT6385976.1 AAA family ATPase [Alphaproteobacteria bacterium]
MIIGAKTSSPLSPDQLYSRCDPQSLPFATTDEVKNTQGVLGQARAMEATRFGLGIRRPAYNLFVHGPEGTGRHSTIREILDQRAAAEPVPSDWCLVNNFVDAHRPTAIELPPGQGLRLRDAVARLVDELKSAIPSAFEAEDYRTRREAIEETFKERQEVVFAELQERAGQKNITLLKTPVGLALAPVKGDEVINPEAFAKLPEAERNKLEADLELLQSDLQEIIRQLPQWDKERREDIRELNREVTRYAVGHLLDALESDFKLFPAVVNYLAALKTDVIENADIFIARGTENAGQQAMVVAAAGHAEADLAQRYEVNLLVDNALCTGAPVVYEDMPTYANLVGRIEHIAEMGALITNFSMIKGGALHRANGGYLLIDAYKLLTQPYAYEGLKRALISGFVKIESLGQVLSLVSTVSLEPEAIPLDLKIVLIGAPRLYYMLHQLDPEFADLFKVSVDYGPDMDRDEESTATYANVIAGLATKEKLKAFDAGAVARLIEFSAREADDSKKLSTRLGQVVDVMREADYWSEKSSDRTVTAEDVQTAIDTRIRRVDSLRERSHEMITRGIKLIDTDGSRVGQINALSVMSLGGYSFGGPSRITARVRMGKGQVVDIEREVELGGPLHSKGVLILSSFLSGLYALDRPLSLSASLVFEQSYGGIDGDSASSAELYCLLSALSGLPIKQCFAVTGSVNQKGEVQPIGGVNEKIEGFFDICKARGFSPGQGVLIPASNICHLMLRADVVEACTNGDFAIYAVETIDQGVEILTGVQSGVADDKGVFPEGTVNALVETRLRDMADDLRNYSRPPESHNASHDDSHDKMSDGKKADD